MTIREILGTFSAADLKISIPLVPNLSFNLTSTSSSVIPQ
jgi:hypothetical protein